MIRNVMAGHKSTLLAVAGFAVVYTLPLWPSSSASLFEHRGAADALIGALKSPPVALGMALTVATHLALLALCSVAFVWLARQWAAAARVSAPLALMLTLTTGWVWLVSGNAVLFPQSSYSVPFAVIANRAACGVSSTVLAAMVGVALWRYRPAHGRSGWGLGAMALGTSLLLLAAWSDPTGPVAAPSARNIIIVGVDSLSDPLMARERGSLPHLSKLLDQTTRYDRAYTPLGRTYPAWVSILSGQPPATHGAVFNLRGLEHAARDGLLSKSLRAQGYHTVYAIDERRFNNIDESFGFDQVVGPRAGVLDFVVQPFNDTPLTNLLLQTRLGQWLLPYSRLNVASHANYDARGFVDEIGRAAGGPQPLFLAVHFLSGHFPFHTRHATADIDDANTIRAHHIEALSAVDAQVGWLMASLARLGRLDNTLVIVLSDHGEAVGENEPVRGLGGELKPSSSYGHGADLLSEHQNRIVLALVEFRNGQPVPAQQPRHEQVSLLDVRAAAEGYARTGHAELKGGADCIPVETELRLASTMDYRHIDPRKVAAEGLGLYELDAQGRMKLREALLAPLIAKKDVGLRCAHRLTLFRPADGRYRAYRLNPGEPPQETDPLPGDIARVADYRQALMKQAAPN
jgi:hypothetical protein